MTRLAGAFLALILAAPLAEAAEPSAERRALERELLRELVEIDTSAGTGGTIRAAEAMAARLRDAGFRDGEIQVLSHQEGLANLLVRLPGRGEKAPILLLAHLDVVPALRDDWSFDPYVFREEEGYYYGRGTSDNKAGVATIVANLVRLRREGFVPDRDLVALLSSDEETTMAGIRWLLERPEVKGAAFALNTDAGFGELQNGEPTTLSVQASEKVYVTFELEVRNRGGHSSLPVPDNAIYRLAEALGRLAHHEFPVRLNEVTREYLERGAERAPPDQASDMRAVAATEDAAAARRLSGSAWFNAVLRTTCVATQLAAGHAENALPQTARATVNCRILPDDGADGVERELKEVIGDDAVALRRTYEAVPSPVSPLTPELLATVEREVAVSWPGVPVVPEMSTGATDGLYVRNAGIPVYGVGALFEDPGDVRAHGRDERVGVESFHEAVAFWYRLLKALSSPGAP